MTLGFPYRFIVALMNFSAAALSRVALSEHFILVSSALAEVRPQLFLLEISPDSQLALTPENRNINCSDSAPSGVGSACAPNLTSGRRDTAQQRHGFHLPSTAGLFKHATDLGAHRMERHSAMAGNLLDRLSGCQVSGHPRLSCGEI